jgi:hypothetical protein
LLSALNCYPDNSATKENLCGSIKRECNRGECPSRGVFCDQEWKCGWNQAAIDAFTPDQKRSILAQRAVGAATPLVVSVSIVAATIVLAFF